jgi:hypothetical protein
MRDYKHCDLHPKNAFPLAHYRFYSYLMEGSSNSNK